MAYPLIILGAGASHDSIDIENIYHGDKVILEKYKPPITGGLFEQSRQICRELLKRYSEVGSLASVVLPKLADGKLTFESILQGFLDSHNKDVQNRNPDVLKELISLNYYLADLFNDISYNFFDVTSNNYKRFIKEMRN